MIDINFIRDNLAEAKKLLARKNVDEKLVQQLFDVDVKWRLATRAMDELRAALKKQSDARAIEDAKKTKLAIKEGETKLAALAVERDELLLRIPNFPDASWPAGRDERENVTLRTVGAKPQFVFTPQNYLTLGEKLGIIDVARAAKVAGSRFGYLFGEAALLEFALVQFAFSTLVKKGFRPVIPPDMIKPSVYRGMGRLAGGQEDERYYLPTDDLFLIGSAEHTIGPIHADEILEEKQLPVRYVGFSSCFRREAGSYGKDTKGILRVHQFDKVELCSFDHPEKSNEEHEFLLSVQEEMLTSLGLHYRVVQNCTGDMGFTDARQYDIETWLPGQPGPNGTVGNYRETNSCSNTTDFQARGVNVKYRPSKGPPQFVHMLNATCFAIGRVLIAIIENYQQADGSIIVPEVLRPYTGFDRISKTR